MGTPAQLAFQSREVGEHLLGPPDDPDRLAAPLDGHLLAGLHLADVHLNGRSSRLGFLAGGQAAGERHSKADRSHSAYSRSGYGQQPPAFVIHMIF